MVAALAVTQTVGYGVLYYAFAGTAATDGRQPGGRVVAGTHTVAQLYAVLIGIGVCAAMVLYEAALAIVVSWFDPRRRGKAVLAVIVVAGFAGTVSMPLTGLLVDRYGWRTALLLIAVLHGAVTIPLHAPAVRKPPRPASQGRQPSRHDRATVVRGGARPRFWWLVVAFVGHGVAMSAMTVQLVGFLVHKDTRLPSPPPSPGCSGCCRSAATRRRPTPPAATGGDRGRLHHPGRRRTQPPDRPSCAVAASSSPVATANSCATAPTRPPSPHGSPISRATWHAAALHALKRTTIRPDHAI